ncbi:unnamed protein product [Closterium sp. NIES-53]
MSLVAPSTAHGEGSREWLVRRARLWSGATGAGDAKTGGARVTAGAGGTGGSVAAGPRGARTRGVGAAGTGGVGAAGAGDPTEPGAAGDGGSCAGAGAVDPGAEGAGGTVRPRPYFVPLLKQVLGVPSSTSLTTPLLCPPPDQLQPPLLSASPLPAPSSYAEQFGGLIEPREPASCPVSPVRTTRRVPRSRPPPVPGTHAMALHSSFVPLRSAAAFDLIAELLDFAAAFRLDYATALVAESASATPPSVGGECALGTDVLEDRHEDFECLGAASMLLPCCLPLRETRMHQTSRPRALSKRRLRVPPPGANIVDCLWIFRVKRPLGSLPAFKARYVARGFNQQLGVDYFRTFSPHPKVDFSLGVAARRCSVLGRPVYGLRQAPREWHDTLRTTLAALGFDPSTADPSLFLRTDTSLLLFYVLVYIEDLVFATADTETQTLVKSELQRDTPALT